MGNNELVAKISNRTGIPQNQCRLVINMLADEITDSLYRGENVTLKGFMSFELSKLSARTVKDLNTGEEKYYPEVRTVNCRISKQIKNILNDKE